MQELKSNNTGMTPRMGDDFDSPIQKILKVDDEIRMTPILSADKENDSNYNTNLPHRPANTNHVDDLTMEEGANLLDRWSNSNFVDFEYWLQNANAQVHTPRNSQY
jgi:hypothetical protein